MIGFGTFPLVPTNKGDCKLSELAAYLLTDFLKRYGVSKTQAYREIHAGRLVVHKRGRRTIVRAENAKAWLDSLPTVEPKAA
jgi:hypothetical protein